MTGRCKYVHRLGDVLTAEQPELEAAGKAAKIMAACNADWQAFSGDCSGFVRNVPAGVGITVTGFATSIVDQIAGANWGPLPDGRPAKRAADGGDLVSVGSGEMNNP